MLADELLRDTMIDALRFMHQTSNVITDTNPHFARILQNTQTIRPTPILPALCEMKMTRSTFEHEASCSPCSSSSSVCNGLTPTSSRASSTAPTPKLNLPVESVVSTEDSGPDVVDSSSMLQDRKSRRTEVLWQHLNDAVRAAYIPPTEHRRVTTTMDQCLRDVMLAESMPDQLLAILPKDSEALSMKEASDLAYQVFDDLDLQVEEDAFDCKGYMDELNSDLPGLCAALHWKLADSVLSQTISRFGGILALVLQDQTQICLLYTSPSPRDGLLSRMPSSA